MTGLKRQPNLTPLREFGIETWGQAALAWILADPRVSVLIPATSRPGRMLENAVAGTITLPPELRDYVGREWERCYLARPPLLPPSSLDRMVPKFAHQLKERRCT